MAAPVCARDPLLRHPGVVDDAGGTVKLHDQDGEPDDERAEDEGGDGAHALPIWTCSSASLPQVSQPRRWRRANSSR